MADNVNEMTQAGFVQSPQFVQATSVQSPTTVVQTTAATSNTDVSPTTVVGGIDNTVNNFSSIIQDNSGGVSSIRVLMLLWGCGVFLVWATLTIVGMFHGVYTMAIIPETVVQILVGIVGIKTVQRFGEK